MKKVMTLCALAALVAITGCNEKKEAAKDIVSFDEVIILNGSPKANGNTATALHEVARPPAVRIAEDSGRINRNTLYQIKPT